MRKTIVGLFSIVLVLASVFGLSSRGPRSRRTTGGGHGPDRVLWI